jgi:peptide/nickel transport system permease protein
MTKSRKESAPTIRSSEGYFRQVWGRMKKNKRGLLGLAFVFLMILVSFFSPLLASGQPILCKYQGQWYAPALVELFQFRGDGPHWVKKDKPFRFPQFNAATEDYEFEIWPLIPYNEYDQVGEFLERPSADHWLGTDDIGRDLAARMIHGTSVSLRVGFISMGIAAIIGIVVGGVAGYYGGRVDMVISRIIEVVICFPVFFLILAIMIWLEPNITNVMIVIGVTRWTDIARYTRGEFMRIKDLDYVIAARAMGIRNSRIMFRHILPNSLAPVMVTITFGIAAAILVEAGLSWLGFGVQPPDPSWGNILQTAYKNIQSSGYLVYPPCIAIFLGVLSYNLVGDALRDAVDPRLKV